MFLTANSETRLPPVASLYALVALLALRETKQFAVSAAPIAEDSPGRRHVVSSRETEPSEMSPARKAEEFPGSARCETDRTA